MKVTEPALLLMSVALSMSGCQPGAQNDTVHADRETYRKEVLSSYDFEQEPMKSDAQVLRESDVHALKVTDTDLHLALGRDKHYYKFFYYSRVDTIGGYPLMTMLGFYDIYYDLLLVSF